MPVNWKDPEAFTRLLASMVAAQDLKLDYRKIATIYGNGATYDAIEGRFRVIRKEAAKMKAEVDSGERPQAPARGSTTSTPRKPRSTPNTPKKNKTITGRVSKKNGVKKEMDSSRSSVEARSTEEDEAVAEDETGVEGGMSDLYYGGDYVDDSMDVGAF